MVFIDNICLSMEISTNRLRDMYIQENKIVNISNKPVVQYFKE